LSYLPVIVGAEGSEVPSKFGQLLLVKNVGVLVVKVNPAFMPGRASSLLRLCLQLEFFLLKVGLSSKT
jgi:hypothetical protein